MEAAAPGISQPDSGFFERAEIPEHIAKPHDPLCYGGSKLLPANGRAARG